MKTNNMHYSVVIVLFCGLCLTPLFAQQRAMKGQTLIVSEKALDKQLSEKITHLDSLLGVWKDLQQSLREGRDPARINLEMQRLENEERGTAGVSNARRGVTPSGTGTIKAPGATGKDSKSKSASARWGEIIKQQSRQGNTVRAERLLNQNLLRIGDLESDLKDTGKKLRRLQTNLAQVEAAKKLKQEAAAENAMRNAKEKSQQAKEMMKNILQVLKEVQEREEQAVEALSRI